MRLIVMWNCHNYISIHSAIFNAWTKLWLIKHAGSLVLQHFEHYSCYKEAHWRYKRWHQRVKAAIICYYCICRWPRTQAPLRTQIPLRFCRESLGTRLYTDASSRQGRLHGTLPTTIEPGIFACGMGAWILSKTKPFSLKDCVRYNCVPPYTEFLVYT